MAFTKVRGTQRLPGWKRILCCASLQCAATISVEIAAAGEPAVVGQLSMACSVTTISGTYKTLSSDYVATGMCSLFETHSRGGAVQLNYDNVNWTAQGSHQPNTKATFETMTLTLTEFGRTTATGTVNSTMQCGSDPWRLTSSGPCRLVTRQTAPPSLGGYLSMAFQQLLQDAPNLPLSFKLNPTQRAALDKQYLISTATRQKPGTLGPVVEKPLGSPLSPATQAGVGATTNVVPDWPVLVEPKPGTRVVQGQFMVKATPPAVGGGFAAEAEFTWLDASALNPYVNLWPLSMDQLSKGIIVPSGVTRGQPGRWQVRTRVASPNKGSWSAPVPFELFLTQPTQSLQNSLETLRTPQQGPAGTTLIRPRGLGNSGTDSADTTSVPAGQEGPP